MTTYLPTAAQLRTRVAATEVYLTQVTDGIREAVAARQEPRHLAGAPHGAGEAQRLLTRLRQELEATIRREARKHV